MDEGYKEAKKRIQKALEKTADFLDLRKLELTAVPPEIIQLTNLQTLSLSKNQLVGIPLEIVQLTNLQTLYLSSNKLTAIPSTIAQLINLQTLDLSKNQLTDFPIIIAQLTNLQSLSLSKNQIVAISPEIAQLTSLQELYLSSNKLTIIPLVIAQLTNLQELYLTNNNLTSVPPEISQLTALRELHLAGNQLTAVPIEFTQLTNLRKLRLNNNQILAIPEWIMQIPQLEELYIMGNPITQPPPELLGRSLTTEYAWDDGANVDLEVVRRYYAQLAKEGEAYFYEAKLLLIGEGGAGKTSLARKLLHPTQPLPAAGESTEGIDVHQWQFDIPAGQDLTGLRNLSGLDQRYTTNVWDFGGQSIYHATHQFFLSNRSVYILLADTRRQHTDFYDWLRMQEAFGGESPLLLLKNQNRQHGSQCVIENLPRLQERYANLQEIVQLDLSGVPDKEAAAWGDFLRYLKRHLLNLKHIGQPVPKTWVAVRKALSPQKGEAHTPLPSGGAGGGKNSISRRDYLDICAKQGIDDPANALQLSQFLHDIGDILHYQHDSGSLADLIILNPLWALDAVYRILDNEEIGNDWGQFNYRQLHDLWDEPQYDNHHTHLLELMQRFQLCYELPQRGHYIAPQLLAPDVPAYKWEKQADDLQLHYRYPGFMPRGILSRAIVALHHRIEEQRLVWRAGVILRDDHARAELLELRDEKEIHIRIGGKLKRDLLMEIVRTLDQLHEGFSGKLTYEKLLPCRCETCAASAAPHFFSLHKLRERLAHRKESVECNNPPYAEVQIRGLIDDAILQMDRRGGDVHHHYGDNITVGNITNAQGVAIGRGANSRTSE